MEYHKREICMRVPKINFLKPQNESPRKKLIKSLIKFTGVFIIIFAGIFFLFSFIISYALPGKSETKPGILQRMATLLPSGERKLIGEKDNRINVLLLGMGGIGHDGPYLTDTNILISFNPKEKKAVLLSIPRDLLVPINDYGWRKLNHVNAFAEVEKAGSGGDEARKALSAVLNIPIPYYVRADFAGFKKIIDNLGGILIDVDRGFTDIMYPTDNFKTKTITFPEGWQVMNGDRALEYARSRHGSNGENTDFARSKRQQKVILAIKDKIFSVGTLLSPLRLIEAMQTTKDNISANFEIWEIVRAADLVSGMDKSDILNYVLDDSPNGFLQAENYEGAYVLMPKNGWSEIKNFVKNIFSESAEQKISQRKINEIKIEIQNGTNISGFAAITAGKLEEAGMNIVFYGNAAKKGVVKTLIVNLNDKEKKDILEQAKKITGGEIISKKLLPDGFAPTTSADILVILGENGGF